MPVVEIPHNVAVDQIEFPEVLNKGKPDERPLKRSCTGALHIRPGVKVVTADELAHIQQVKPTLHRQMRLVALTADERAEVKSEQVKKAPPVVVPPPVVDENTPKNKR
jgi:hypothetical protein